MFCLTRAKRWQAVYTRRAPDPDEVIEDIIDIHTKVTFSRTLAYFCPLLDYLYNTYKSTSASIKYTAFIEPHRPFLEPTEKVLNSNANETPPTSTSSRDGPCRRRPH